MIFTSGTDDSQTYVVSSAARAGLTPEELALRSATQIRATLEAAGISVDGFAPFDKGYRQTVIDFVTDLHTDGAFRLKTVRLPYVEATGEFLMEGLVAGDCPVCLVESRGGLCESCGHPNNFDELLRPRSTVDPDAVVTHHEAQILVLPMEEYRDRLADYYVRHRDVLRPHTAQLVREALDRPLPDFPITYRPAGASRPRSARRRARSSTPGPRAWPPRCTAPGGPPSSSVSTPTATTSTGCPSTASNSSTSSDSTTSTSGE